MKITLDFPDLIYKDDKVGYDKFFRALQLMLNRMANSHEKYQGRGDGTLKGSTEAIDLMLFARQRAHLYDGRDSEHVCTCAPDDNVVHAANCFLVLNSRRTNTGNTENLLDAANGLVLEHLNPKHPKAHFRSQSSAESPGRPYVQD